MGGEREVERGSVELALLWPGLLSPGGQRGQRFTVLVFHENSLQRTGPWLGGRVGLRLLDGVNLWTARDGGKETPGL